MPLIAEIVLSEAEKRHDGVRKNLEVYLIEILRELYKKYAPVLNREINADRIMKLVQFTQKSKEY